MTLTELKAQAYDILSNLEFLQKKLQETNQAIGEKMKEIQDQPDIPTIHG
jgi:Lhr-like helicase